MKLLLDDKATHGCNLNANEACIFAAILKCTRAGRGWYGNYRELAAAMPFVMSHMTAHRAVEKLLNLGLVERRENKLFALYQNVTESSQNVTNLEQNVTNLEQIVTKNDSPLYPLINNNDMMNEKNATCAHTCDTRTPETPSFIIPEFLDLTYEYQQKGGDHIVKGAVLDLAQDAWRKCTPAKKVKLLEAVRSGAHFKPRLDWLITDFPEPQPDFLRGDEDCPIVQVRYNGLYKLCTPETMQLFELEYVRIWKSK